ncbi:uncharacterized protein BDR25DRAFT_186331, partial [Lindgomyces ingoldianus]
EICAEISRTVALQHYSPIEDHNDAYSNLVALKRQLAPTSTDRQRILIEQYRALQKKPRKDFEAWLNEWLQTVGQCRRASLPDVQGTRAQTDFLHTIKPLAPEFAASALLHITEKE